MGGSVKILFTWALFASALLVGGDEHPVKTAWASIESAYLASEKSVRGEDLRNGGEITVPSGKRGMVVIFMSAKCPCSNSHNEEVKSLISDYKEFSFVIVNANADEDRSMAKSYFDAIDFPAPVLRDHELKLADHFKALKTPHAFLINSKGDILYRGGVTSSNRAEKADRHFLREALSDIQAGRDVKTKEGRTLGCAISRGEKYVW